jgi:4-hydroxy-4-methyl-2-oxoglutarate aldolase
MEDFVFADDDGSVFVPRVRVPDIVAAAHEIYATEPRHANRVRHGVSLREQFRYADFVAKRTRQPTRTFRDHLREIEAAIEE